MLPKGLRLTHVEMLPRGCEVNMSSRRDYLNKMRDRYRRAQSRAEKSALISETVNILGCHRKHAIRLLNQPKSSQKVVRRRKRPQKYAASLPVILVVWRALDCICAERLHPVLLQTAELLERHGELNLTEENRAHLAAISRATLGRMLKQAKSTRSFPNNRLQPKPTSRLKAQVPIESYSYKENKPGALEVDLVEHNGGSSLGHFAYTISVVDVVTGISMRRATLGKGQLGIHKELKQIVLDWPYKVWGIHTDNGTEFLNDHILRFCQKETIRFTRSRPYKKNDNPHVEQKNFQHVRCLVGYERYDSPQAVAWLNEIYRLYDPYVNLFQPTRKLIHKERHGSKVRKRYSKAVTPYQRACDMGAITGLLHEILMLQYEQLNPLELHRQIEALLFAGPDNFCRELSPQLPAT